MTVINTSTASTATAYSNQRKVDRCQNGVLWAMFWDGTSTTGASLDFYYSTDNGATWTKGSEFGFAGTGTTYTPNASLFIDLDDYAHVVYKDRHDGYIYYRRGTPNAERTAWTWSGSATQVFTAYSTYCNYPDIVVHREGTGWVAHLVTSQVASDASGQRAVYDKVTIASGGGLTVAGKTDLSGFIAASNHTWPSIDFNHTGDGKTVAGGTPHLYVAWSSGLTGAGNGIRFKKATYSAESWTWGTEREIDSTRYIGLGQWINCMFDGTRVVIPGFMADDDVVLYERDAADTTTTTRLLLDAPTTAERLAHGSSSYDGNGNVYLFGRNADEAAGTYDLVYRKWTRATTALGAEVIIDAGVGDPYVSAKRGYSNNRIEFVYTDGTASPYNVTYDGISLNTAPNAPTSLSPDGTTLDKDAAQRFSWTFSDPDAGDAQSAYDLRYRVQGTSTWTTVSGGATQYHDFAGGTFTAGDWEWQARTTDNSGSVGPWSSSATFTAATPPAAPSISSPTNGGTISTTSHTVTWTASSQDAYEVRRVADSAGTPDTSTVYDTTGTVVSTGKSQSMTFDVNGRTEHVQVRVRSGGLWSSWASVKVTVSYTAPATPTAAVTANDATASISIAITNPTPTGSEPTVVRNEVWVRVASGGRQDIDRTVGDDGVRLSSDTANGGTFVDYLPRPNTSYEYRVKAIGDNGGGAWSTWAAA